MSEEPDKSSKDVGEAPSKEAFSEPKPNSLASLTDGRKIGEFHTVYPKSVWAQIIAELVYLLAAIGLSIVMLLYLSFAVFSKAEILFFGYSLGQYPDNNGLLIWIVMGLAGLCGGASSSLKWLYHTVAKQRWHRDRIVWRLVVPPLSAILSVFTGMMVSTGFLPPIFSQTAFESLVFDAGFGFFLGFFSDNLLAWLQNFAYKVFGVVDKDSAAKK